jgi:predicted DsbA family dithiol-disulfide isomerase
MSTVVDFHFDPMCPFAYQTSLWIRDVREQVGIGVNWRFFSLEEVNRAEGKKHPWEREWSYGWSLMRNGTLLNRTDMTLLDKRYAVKETRQCIEGVDVSRAAAGRYDLCFFFVAFVARL